MLFGLIIFILGVEILIDMQRIVIIILCLSIGITVCNLTKLNAQTKDSVSGQPLTISLDASGETDLAYVLPHTKQVFLKELGNPLSQVHLVLDNEIKKFYNDSGILITSNDYPLKISKSQFLLTPLSYYFDFKGLQKGSVTHYYSFLVTIPIIQTGSSVRVMGTINLTLSVEDKESVDLKELKKLNIETWSKYKSYKRRIFIVDVKGINITPAKRKEW